MSLKSPSIPYIHLFDIFTDICYNLYMWIAIGALILFALLLCGDIMGYIHIVRRFPYIVTEVTLLETVDNYSVFNQCIHVDEYKRYTRGDFVNCLIDKRVYRIEGVYRYRYRSNQHTFRIVDKYKVKRDISCIFFSKCTVIDLARKRIGK